MSNPLENSAHLVSVLEGLQSAILVEDEHRRVVLANPKFCALFGIPVEHRTLIGADCDLMAEEAKASFSDPEGFITRVEELLIRNEPVEGDELRMGDGRTLLRDFIPVEVGGKRSGHLWQYRDVTALRAEEALNRAIVDTALDGIVTIDHEGRIVEFNPAAERMFGHARDAVLGMTMGDVIVPEALRAAHKAGMQRYLASHEPVILGRRMELAAVRSDGTEFPIELAVSRIPDSEPPMFTGFIRDVTPERRQEEELRKAKEAAEDASRAKSDFLATMSHEIRTPMNAILGMTELSLDQAENGEQKSLLRSVLTNAESLLHVINDVLDLSKVEAGRMALREEAFSLADVVESVTEALSSRAFEKGLELSCTIDPSLSTPVEGDPNRLRQALVNLIGNSVKFTERGYIEVSVSPVDAHPDGRWVRFSVSDTGIGIPEDALERVFEPFFQSEATLARELGGTGLGLGITSSVAQLMGGRIWAESTLGRGSTFTLEIPLPRSTQAFARRRTSDSRFERWQAWVLTPSQGVAQSVTSALAGVGIPCRVASPESLGEEIERHTPPGVRHLVVGDQRLGLTVLGQVANLAREAARKREVRLCVLVPPGPVDPWRVQGPPDTSYIVKPANRRKLCAAVARPDTGAEEVRASGPTHQGLQGHILLVEDNPANQTYATLALQRAGYRVDVAEDGLVGLRMATEHTYDLIISDLDMPEMDGLEMTQEILARAGDDAPPILAFTAHAVEGFRERCLEAGMAGYVTKPARPDELLKAVGEAMRTGRTILVVDDNPDNLELTRRYLNTERLTVETLNGGRAAIDRIREGGVAAVLLDMSMPDLDGYETARRIRALGQAGNLPILAMTSWVGAEEEERCLAAGCTAYIAKPLRRDELLEALAELLDPRSTDAVMAPPSGDPVLVDPAIADLIPEYLEARVKDVDSLRVHMRKGDLESIRVLAHNLAGSGEPYGFPRLTEFGRTLESVAVSGGPEEVGAWIDELHSYLMSIEWRPDAGD